MKNLLAMFFSFISISSFAASITVPKFDLEILVDTQKYDVDFELEMACRYEKFIIGDSAQYEYTTKKVPLIISKKNTNTDEQIVLIKNIKQRVLNLTGYFKTNKECQTYLNFFLKSKIYSIGWANQYQRPIRLGLFEHSRRAEYKVFDIKKLMDLIGNRKLSFLYNPVGPQVNTSFAIDDVKAPGMSSYLRQSVAQDPETGMPFLLKGSND